VYPLRPMHEKSAPPTPFSRRLLRRASRDYGRPCSSCGSDTVSTIVFFAAMFARQGRSGRSPKPRSWGSRNGTGRSPRKAKPISIGTAFFDRGRCLPWAMDIPCIVCEEFCPTSPKAIWTAEEQVTRSDGTPLLCSAHALMWIFASVAASANICARCRIARPCILQYRRNTFANKSDPPGEWGVSIKTLREDPSFLPDHCNIGRPADWMEVE